MFWFHFFFTVKAAFLLVQKAPMFITGATTAEKSQKKAKKAKSSGNSKSSTFHEKKISTGWSHCVGKSGQTIFTILLQDDGVKF